MADGAQVRTPTVLWAQRRDRVFLTIDLANAESPKVNLKDEGTLSFSATAGPSEDEKHKYAVELEFMHPVNAKDSKISVGPRSIVVMVMKTEEAGRRHHHVIFSFGSSRATTRRRSPCSRKASPQSVRASFVYIIVRVYGGVRFGIGGRGLRGVARVSSPDPFCTPLPSLIDAHREEPKTHCTSKRSSFRHSVHRDSVYLFGGRGRVR